MNCLTRRVTHKNWLKFMIKRAGSLCKSGFNEVRSLLEGVSRCIVSLYVEEGSEINNSVGRISAGLDRVGLT